MPRRRTRGQRDGPRLTAPAWQAPRLSARALPRALDGLDIMGGATVFIVSSKSRIWLWCLGAWVFFIAVAIAGAAENGVVLSNLLRPAKPGPVDVLQRVVMSITISALGLGLALTTEARYPDGSIKWYAMNAKVVGWMCGFGGIFGAFRILGLL